MARTGTTVVHVPYRGIADATKDLLGGHAAGDDRVDPGDAAARRGQARARARGDRREAHPADARRAVAGRSRASRTPSVINYWGIVAPAGTPREPIVRIAAEVKRVLAQPDVRERLEREGAELIPGEPADARRADRARPRELEEAHRRGAADLRIAARAAAPAARARSRRPRARRPAARDPRPAVALEQRRQQHRDHRRRRRRRTTPGRRRPLQQREVARRTRRRCRTPRGRASDSTYAGVARSVHGTPCAIATSAASERAVEHAPRRRREASAGRARGCAPRSGCRPVAMRGRRRARSAMPSAACPPCRAARARAGTGARRRPTPSVAATSMRAVSGVAEAQAHADRAHEHDRREHDGDEPGRDVALGPYTPT